MFLYYLDSINKLVLLIGDIASSPSSITMDSSVLRLVKRAVSALKYLITRSISFGYVLTDRSNSVQE